MFLLISMLTVSPGQNDFILEYLVKIYFTKGTIETAVVD